MSVMFPLNATTYLMEFHPVNRRLKAGRPSGRALVALKLLTASSAPDQKDLLIRLIVNLLMDDPEENVTVP
jgi:hypothetical protein